MRCTPKVRPKILTIGVYFYMVKFDLEFKLKVINEYKNGLGGYKSLGKRHGVSTTLVKTWCVAYSAFGIDGLKRKKDRTNYSLEEKLAILKWKRENNASYITTSVEFGMNNPALISHWSRRFNSYGMDGLAGKRKGSPDMNKKSDTHVNDNDYVKNLEHENQLLKAELAYLKKLKASRINIPNRLLKSNHELLKNSEKDSD